MLKYLRLTRAHTVPLEAVPALVGAAVASGGLLNADVFLWGIFGVLYHLSGYGHNSLRDWQKGYDTDDPYKQHHPLNTKELSPVKADVFIKLLLAVTVVYAIILSSPNYLALGMLAAGVMCGILYNEVGKRTPAKFLLISLAHTTTFTVPYVAAGGGIDTGIFAFGSLSVFIWVVFQISVSGEIKDITQEESNFLKEIGSYTDGERISFSRYSKIYSFSLTFLKGMSIVALAFVSGGSPLIYAVLILPLWFMMAYTIMLMGDGRMKRHRRVRFMSIVEMATVLSFALSVSGVIGFTSAILVCVASVAWVIGGNRLLWGTVVGPRV